jgi:uncharacterized Tic20 family protein
MTSDTNTPETSVPNTNFPNTDVFGMKPNSYCMLLHLSQLLNFLSGGFPFLGIIVPIVLWMIGKDKSPQVDQHGKIVLNWLISLFIYAAIGMAIAVVLSIFTIAIAIGTGFPMPIGFILFGPIVLLVWILMAVFPIIGAVKANEGTAWKYPLSIPFFK